jgi:hypothetical protein
VSDNSGSIIPLFTVFNIADEIELLRLKLRHGRGRKVGEVSFDDPHSYRLEQSRVCNLKRVRDRKLLWDPKLLLNPGKMEWKI